ncbi:MAG: phenylalanine--tRNA ligase subunit alpha, partial [Saprospiraceae bacterium]|nr:phenylalanine--tRNA ligase subunit alpha [Saprospiraceae bacterium]
MTDQLFSTVDLIISEIETANPTTKGQLEEFRVRYVGSKNCIKPLFGEIKNISADRKKEYGQLVNKAKTLAEDKFNTLKEAMGDDESKDKYAHIDVTAPGDPLSLGSRHPVSIVMNRIIDIFTAIGFVVVEDREIEDDWHNFTAMNTPEDHPARDMQDTFYLKDSSNYLLRTHTSSVQARLMTSQAPPIRIIAPGRVYRNETISSRSHCQFHQVEGLYIDKKV